MTSRDDARSAAARDIVDWLQAGAHARPEEVVRGLAERMVGASIPLSRLAVFVTTLHPELFGSRFTWTPTGGVVAMSFPPSLKATDEYRVSPTARVVEANREVRWRLTGAEPLELKVLEEQRALGVTDYVGHPLRFANGEVHIAIFCSDAPAGFREDDLALLRDVAQPLARVMEILALRRDAANLLDVYVGHHAGERILAGHVHRGDTERIRCVIWFSDLRGFTTLSAERDPESTIGLLNRLFDCQVGPVERHAGEVLKFIGDGMLAIFRVDDPAGAGPVVEEAVSAAREAFGALDRWNAERAMAGLAPLAFGLALHEGDVAYGNIGSARRLDFTCIGAAVNLAARVEGLTGKLGKRLLLTASAARVVDLPLRSLGAHALKGVDEPEEVFELVLGPSSPGLGDVRSGES